MDKYKAIYRDCGEANDMRIRAYDADHAEEKFWDAIEDWQGDHRGIELIGIYRIKSAKATA